MNDKLKDFLVGKLGFDYGYLEDDRHHIFESDHYIITFDDRYKFIAIDNHIGEYTIDYSDCGLE